MITFSGLVLTVAVSLVANSAVQQGAAATEVLAAVDMRCSGSLPELDATMSKILDRLVKGGNLYDKELTTQIRAYKSAKASCVAHTISQQLDDNRRLSTQEIEQYIAEKTKAIKLMKQTNTCRTEQCRRDLFQKSLEQSAVLSALQDLIYDQTKVSKK